MDIFGLNLNYTMIAIASAFFSAIATILARPLLKQIDSKSIIGINFLTMGVVLLLLSPLFYKFQASAITFAVLISISLIDTAANYYYFKTFEKTEAAVAAPLLALSPTFTFIFSWILLKEGTSIYNLILALLIIIITVTSITDFSNFAKTNTATLIPAMIAVLLFGLSAVPAKYLLNNLQVINAPTLYMFRAGFIALFSLLLFGFNITAITVKQYRLIFVRGLFVIAQWILLYYAISRGNTGVSATLANIAPVFVFILAAIFLKEKITWKKMLAALAILILSLII